MCVPQRPSLEGGLIPEGIVPTKDGVSRNACWGELVSSQGIPDHWLSP